MKALMLAVLMTATPLLAQPIIAPPAPVPANGPASPTATAIAGRLLPNGTYRQLLGSSFRQMVGGMTDNIGRMPLGPLLKAAGLDQAQAAKMDKASIGELMELIDPVYRERNRRMTEALFDAMIPLMEQMEPDLRAGLAQALDSRFKPAQLADIAAFFATPTGAAYAAQQMGLFTDPAMMSRMQTVTPKLMDAMPQLIAQAMKATSDLPAPKKFQDLSPVERRKFASLLGVDPAELDKK